MIEEVKFSFWKKIPLDCFLQIGEVLEPESVLVGNKLFVTGKSINGRVLEMMELQQVSGPCEMYTFEIRPVQGQHPTTDGVNTIYLLALPENSDYRYQVIEYSLETNTGMVLPTTGISPKQRKPPLSCIYHGSALYFFGGLQMYRGDATGSFVYKLDLESKEWNNIDYSGIFPATKPHAPMTGCRSGHSTAKVGNSIYIFGGTMVEDSLLNPECLTSSVFDSL